MSADPPRHQGKVRFLRDASLFDPQGPRSDLGRYVGLQVSLEYCPAG